MEGILRRRHGIAGSGIVVLAALAALMSLAPAALAHGKQHVAQASSSKLPRALTRAKCLAESTRVRGLGRACEVRGGFQVMVPGHGMTFTHGGDEIPQDVMAPLPGALLDLAASGAPIPLRSAMAVEASAGADQVSCVDGATTNHFEAIFAIPSNVPDRSAQLLPVLRSELERASGFVNREAQLVNPAARARLRFTCSSNAIDIAVVRLARTNGGDSFSNIQAQLKTLGYGNPLAHYVIYYDGRVSCGCSGLGSMRDSDVASTSNPNLAGGFFAMQFGGNAYGRPDWSVLLHEMAHTMGAVNSTSAPHRTGAGHCTDGRDVMCYADGGYFSYSPSVCAELAFDCRRDDYFNPSPPAGSYLASHWNLASDINSYIDHGPTIAPGMPTALAATVSSGTISLTWSAPAGMTPTGYRIYRWAGTAWNEIALSGSTSFVDKAPPSTTTYAYAVRSNDALGNRSSISPVVMAGSTAIAAPSGVTATATTSGSVSLGWMMAAPTTLAAAKGYIAYSCPVSGGVCTETPVASQTASSATIAGLAPATKYCFLVGAFDVGNNTAVNSTPTCATTSALQAPTGVGAAGVGARSALVSWSAPADDVAVTSYQVFQRRPTGGWTRVAVAPATSRSTVVSGLMYATTYTFSVRTIATGGQSSMLIPVDGASATTLDPPVASALTATGSSGYTVSFSWTAPADTTAVAGYRLMRQNGTGWKLAGIVYGAATTQAVGAGLLPNTTYGFRVFAFDSSGASYPGYATASGTTGNPPAPSLRIPSNVRSPLTSSTSLAVTWDLPASLDGIAGYNVYRVGPTSATLAGSVKGASATSYTLQYLAPMTSYDIAVAAVDVTGAPLSKSTTATLTTADQRPVNLTVSTLGATSATVTWTLPSNMYRVTGFRIFRTPVGGSRSLVATVDSSTTSAAINNLVTGTTYQFTVAGISASGTMLTGSVVTATPT